MIFEKCHESDNHHAFYVYVIFDEQVLYFTPALETLHDECGTHAHVNDSYSKPSLRRTYERQYLGFVKNMSERQ